MPTQGYAAMITDIVANLSVREAGNPAGDYAVSLASLLDAHITGSGAKMKRRPGPLSTGLRLQPSAPVSRPSR
jgi:hypothetical protein